MVRTLVIVPAFNEAQNLQGVASRLRSIADLNLEILVVNDGSSDATSAVATAAGLHCVNLPFNMGIGNAVHTGYLYAERNGFDFALQFDGDGQHPELEIRKIIEALEGDEADVVIGSRFLLESSLGFKSTASRRLGIRFLSKLIHLLTGHLVTDPTSGFRGINKRALKVYSKYYPHDYPEPEAIVVGLRNGLRIKEVAVEMRERQSGKSSISSLWSVYYMFKVSLAVWIKSIEYGGSYASHK